MPAPCEFEDELQECLQAVAIAADGQSWPDTEWTRAVKKAIAGLGLKLECDVWATGCDVEVRGGEWLYDAVWLKYHDGQLVDIPLVMELEWSVAHVYDDFEKLLVARARQRLMIFQAKTEEIAQHRFSQFETRIRRFGFTTPGDCYLFACWVQKTRRFVFRPFRP